MSAPSTTFSRQAPSPGTQSLAYHAIDRNVRASPSPNAAVTAGALFSADNEAFRAFLISTVILFAKTIAMAWIQVLESVIADWLCSPCRMQRQVWYGVKNNSFSRVPEDVNTGDTVQSARKTEVGLCTQSSSCLTSCAVAVAIRP